MMTNPIPKAEPITAVPDKAAQIKPQPVVWSFLSDLMSRSSETAIRHGGRTFALEPGYACGVIMVLEPLSDR